VPQDSQELSRAQTLRAQILATQAESLGALQKDLGEATFFDTRGGFQRVASGVDELVSLYGENNIEDFTGVQTLRAAAQQRLAEIDAAQHGAERERLDKLAKAFEAAQQVGLAAVVQEYAKRLGGN